MNAENSPQNQTQSQSTSDPNERDFDREARQRSTHRRLTRRMRLVGKLMHLEMAKAFEGDHPATRGEVKTAARALDERIEAAVTEEDLATALETLDKIAEAMGGRDALPFVPRSPFSGRHSTEHNMHEHGHRSHNGHRGRRHHHGQAGPGGHSGHSRHSGHSGHSIHPRRDEFESRRAHHMHGEQGHRYN